MKTMKKLIATTMTCIMLVSMMPATETYAATNGWVAYGSDTYYYVNGVKQYGWVYYNSNYYYMDPYDGHMRRDYLVFNSNDIPVYYVGIDGTLQYNTWVYIEEIDGYLKCAYAGNDGKLVTGWHTIYGTKYYFSKESALMANGQTLKIDGVWYAFDTDGGLAKNKWVKEGGSVYAHEYDGYKYIDYFYGDSKGRAVTGWKKISGKWYYFDKKDDCLMVRGFKNIGKKRYYFNSKGVLKTGGWFKVKKSGKTKWYYAYKDGSLARGWKKIGGKKYYFNKKTGARS